MLDPDRSQKIRLRSVFVSDVHLGSRDCRAAELLRFLESIESDYLFLVGDIVDHEDDETVMPCARYAPRQFDSAPERRLTAISNTDF